MPTEEEGRRTFPARLRKLRLGLEMSAADLAKRVGVRPRQIYRYEWGSSFPSAPVIHALAKVFRKKPRDLAGFVMEPPW